MGYYTKYELTHDANEAEGEKIREYIEANETVNYAIGEYPEACKWYNWAKDMEEMSRQFPSVTFTLEGHGEKYGDIWRAIIKNGFVKEKKKGTITF